MTQTLLANAKLILVSVVIPLLLMAVFTLIRQGFGNSATAMPDALIFLSVVDFYFAIEPDPWMPIIHDSVKNVFPELCFAFALTGIIVFFFGLKVERKLIRFGVRRTYPQAIDLMPADVINQRYPYFGITCSWFFIACLVALNALPFVQR